MGAAGLKPSPAAKEVIRAVKKAKGETVNGSCNGWGFWSVTETGEHLESIRPKPAGTRRWRPHNAPEI